MLHSSDTGEEMEMGQWAINRFQGMTCSRWYVGFIQSSYPVWYTNLNKLPSLKCHK